MRTVNLSILATAFSGHAKEESNYKRLQRFMREFEMPYAELALFIVKLLGCAGPYTLALDRTNWKVGAVDLNILMLSIVYRGIGIPVVWIVLSKSGASDTSERTTVMEIFLDLFGAQRTRVYWVIANSSGANGSAFSSAIGSNSRCDCIETRWFATGEDSMCDHLGLCYWPLASECQRTETEETWVSAKECLPPWTQYLAPFSD